MHTIVTGKVTLHPLGVGHEEGAFDFYGWNDIEDSEYSQGVSIIPEHNSSLYNSSKDRAIKVSIINFSSYLESMSIEFVKSSS